MQPQKKPSVDLSIYPQLSRYDSLKEGLIIEKINTERRLKVYGRERGSDSSWFLLRESLREDGYCEEEINVMVKKYEKSYQRILSDLEKLKRFKDSI